MKDFNKLEAEIAEARDKFINIESINEFKIKYLGKKGIISLEMKELANLSGNERKKQAEKLNKIKDTILKTIDTKTEEKLTCDDGAKDFLHGMGIADTCEIFTWHIFLGGQMVEQRSIACEKMDGSYEIVKGYHNLN